MVGKTHKKKFSFQKTILLFIIGVIIFPSLWFILDWNKHRVIRNLAMKANYPEIKNQTPTFSLDIRTNKSITHVISYLPKSLFSRENFDEQAAQNTIAYVEKIAGERNEFLFDPFATKGFQVHVKLVPRATQSENFVFFISEKESLPAILLNVKDESSLLSDSIKYNSTFFYTVSVAKGAASFLYFTEPKTVSNGFPTKAHQELTPLQQLNVGFNVEIWKRSAVVETIDKNEEIPNPEQTNLTTAESLWNTFGQLVIAKQEYVPLYLLQERLKKRIISIPRNRAYYPFDSKSQRIYQEAPTSPVIR